MKKLTFALLGGAVSMLLLSSGAMADSCIDCHTKISPGQVQDWKVSKRSQEDVSCVDCHGDKHSTAEDYKNAQLPDEHVCAECHQEQFDSFAKGKHNFGWTSLNAIPATHMAPDELMEGGRGCGGCHNMGIKSEEQKKEQDKKMKLCFVKQFFHLCTPKIFNNLNTLFKWKITTKNIVLFAKETNRQYPW